MAILSGSNTGESSKTMKEIMATQGKKLAMQSGDSTAIAAAMMTPEQRTLAEAQRKEKAQQEQQLLQEQSKQPIVTSEITPNKLIANNPIGLVEQTGFGQATMGESMIDMLRRETPEQRQALADMTRTMKERGLTPEQMTSDRSMQNYLKLGLNDVDVQTLNEGQAKVDSLGMVFEGIPIVGRLKKYTGPIGMPAGKINEIEDALDENDKLINQYVANAVANPAKAGEYLKLIQNLNNELIKGESRIKLLMIQSPDMQANPEDAIKVQSHISLLKDNTQTAINTLLLR